MGVEVLNGAVQPQKLLGSHRSCRKIVERAHAGGAGSQNLGRGMQADQAVEDYGRFVEKTKGMLGTVVSWRRGIMFEGNWTGRTAGR